ALPNVGLGPRRHWRNPACRFWLPCRRPQESGRAGYDAGEEKRRRVVTVLIAGGGIGGLALALSLHQIGVKCRVFESVREIKPLGVGINVLPHAARELIELGL